MIGTAQIVLASIVELPVLIFLRKTRPLFLRYLVACYARKNVRLQLFLLSSSLIICDCRFFILVIAAVHESCSPEMDTPVHSNVSITSFCGKNCREVAKLSIYFSSRPFFNMACYCGH